MARDYTLWNLKEAAQELATIIASLESGDGDEFNHASLDHLYHHINTAWNARDVSEERAQQCSEADFNLWRRFPDDLMIGAE